MSAAISKKKILKIKKGDKVVENKASDYIREENLGEKILNSEGPGITEQKKFNFFDFLKTPTGEGDINNYKNHPLNYNKSDSISQILRGATGLLGKLDLAIIDIIMGVLRIVTENRNININNLDESNV